MARCPTSSEARLWSILEPLGGWERQRVVQIQHFHRYPGKKWRYILDFYNHQLGLCIEVDGPIHARQRGRDRRRDKRLALHGIRTLRFTNREVDEYPGWVQQRITYVSNER